MPERAIYSRQDAVGHLKRLARTSPPLFNDLEFPLRRAILLYWGSMSKAREALDLRPLDAPRQVWSRKRVIDEIARLHRAGQHMSANAVMKAGRNDLVVAAAKYAGGWTRARRLAGVAFKRQRSRTTTAWDAATVIDEIMDRHASELPLAVSKAPKPLVCAANRIFGSWRDAVEASGIDYETVLLSRTYSDDELLEWLRQLARAKPTMTLFDLDQHGEHAVVCRRRWGSYEDAAVAAGLVAWPIRTRRPAISRREVLRVLRQRHSSGETINVRAVRQTDGGHSLINSVVHHFTTWEAALVAAGLRPRPAGRAPRARTKKDR